MKNEETQMTEAVRELLRKKQDFLEEMKNAGRIVETYLAEVDIRNILTYGGL